MIANEVAKLRKARLIKEIQYLTWVTNVILVQKTNDKWRMCVDFKDLNKACPKDYYPFPTIDHLVYATTDHAVYSPVDAISDYHQILMEPRD